MDRLWLEWVCRGPARANVSFRYRLIFHRATRARTAIEAEGFFDMPPQRDRSRSPPDPLFDWEGPSDDGSDGEEQPGGLDAHGDTLEEYLLHKFALGIMDAQTICVIAYMAVQAGAQGDGLGRLAYTPDRSTGNYMKHLKKLLPIDTGDLYSVAVPAKVKGCRTKKTF
jgi:hypothetical protein